MADVTAVTRAEQEQYGFAGTAIYPSPKAYGGTLKGVSLNTNDDDMIKPDQVTGPGASVDTSQDDKKG